MLELITNNGWFAALSFFIVLALHQVCIIFVRNQKKGEIEDIHKYFYKSIATRELRKKIIILLLLGPIILYFLYLLSIAEDMISQMYVSASIFVIAYFFNLSVATLIAGFGLANKGDHYLNLNLKTDKVLITLGILYFIVYQIMDTAFILASLVSTLVIGITDFFKNKKMINTPSFHQ